MNWKKVGVRLPDGQKIDGILSSDEKTLVITDVRGFSIRPDVELYVERTRRTVVGITIKGERIGDTEEFENAAFIDLD